MISNLRARLSIFATALTISASALSANIAVNPHFDGGLSGWNVISPGAVYDPTVNAPSSLGGSARILNDVDQSGNPSCTSSIVCVTVFRLDQYVKVVPGTSYDFGGQVFIRSGQTAIGRGVISVAFLTDAFTFIPGAFRDGNFIESTGQWGLSQGSIQAPPTAAWARVVLLVGRYGPVGALEVNFDDIFFRAPDPPTAPSLSCPPPRIVAGCTTRAIGPLPYSQVARPISINQLQAEGGGLSAQCGIASLTYQDTRPGACPNLVVKRTFSVVDMCGQSSSCTQSITSARAAGPLPDLTVASATFSAFPWPPSFSRVYIFWDFFPVAKVTNLGTVPARNVGVNFELIGASGGNAYAVIDEIGPGQSVFVVPRRDSRLVWPGSYVLRVTIDSRQRQAELSEANNVYETPVSLPEF